VGRWELEPAFDVASAAGREQHHVQHAVHPDGLRSFAWLDGGDGETQVAMRVYDLDGPITEGEFVGARGLVRSPVPFTTPGGFGVAWALARDIRLASFDPVGTQIGTTVVVNQTEPLKKSTRGMPAVASLDDGTTAVAWSSLPSEENGRSRYLYRRFDPTAHVFVGDEQVLPQDSDDELPLDVTADGDELLFGLSVAEAGSVVAPLHVWRIDRDDVPAADWSVDPWVTSSAVRPSVGVAGDRVAVAWREGDPHSEVSTGAYLRLFERGGCALLERHELSAHGGIGTRPVVVAHDDTLVVAWEEDLGTETALFVQAMSAFGVSALTQPLRIDDPVTAEADARPFLSSRPLDNGSLEVLVSWEQGVHARRTARARRLVFWR